MVTGFGFDFDISSLTCSFSEPQLLEVTMPRLRSENLHIHTFKKISLTQIPKRVRQEMFFEKSISLSLILNSQLPHIIFSICGLTGFRIGEETSPHVVPFYEIL